jgi:hypothetical protein
VIGDPEKTLYHVSKSAGNLSDALKVQGIKASSETVRRTLKQLGYRMQGNRNIFCSLLTAEAPTVSGGGNGNMSCMGYRMRSVSRFGFAIDQDFPDRFTA